MKRRSFLAFLGAAPIVSALPNVAQSDPLVDKIVEQTNECFKFIKDASIYDARIGHLLIEGWGGLLER